MVRVTHTHTHHTTHTSPKRYITSNSSAKRVIRRNGAHFFSAQRFDALAAEFGGFGAVAHCFMCVCCFFYYCFVGVVCGDDVVVLLVVLCGVWGVW